MLLGLQNISHTRVLLYLPSQLLVIVDHMIPKHESNPIDHVYTRRLHYADNVKLTAKSADSPDYYVFFEKDNELELAAHVEDWSELAGSTRLALIRGQLEPVVQGWTYPWLRVPVPAFVSKQTTRGEGEVLLVTAMRLAAPSTGGLVNSATPGRLLQPVAARPQQNGDGEYVYTIHLAVADQSWKIEVSPSAHRFEAVVLP